MDILLSCVIAKNLEVRYDGIIDMYTSEAMECGK